jgi:hypothetical protein
MNNLTNLFKAYSVNTCHACGLYKQHDEDGMLATSFTIIAKVLRCENPDKTVELSKSKIYIS